MIKCQNHHEFVHGNSMEFLYEFVHGELRTSPLHPRRWMHHIQTLIMSQMPDGCIPDLPSIQSIWSQKMPVLKIFPDIPWYSQSQFQLPRSFRSWRWCSVSWTPKTSQVFRVAQSYWWSRWGSGASRGRRREAVEDFGWMFSGKNCLLLILTLVLYPKQCGHTWGSYGRSR